MGKEPWVVVDGPLAGETYAHEAAHGVELHVPTGDGRAAVYFVKPAREYGEKNRLLYIGVNPPKVTNKYPRP